MTTTTLRGDATFAIITNDGKCWRCGADVAAYFGYEAALGPCVSNSVCYVVVVSGGSFRHCARGLKT